jgi:hypothetical protein
MPWLRRTAGLGNRLSGQPGESRFSWRARVIAGQVAALAMLGALAVVAVARSGGPAPDRVWGLGCRARRRS